MGSHRIVAGGVGALLLMVASVSATAAALAPSPTPSPTPAPSIAASTRTTSAAAAPAVAAANNPALAALFVTQSVPANTTAGQTVAVSVTMQNTGTATWTAAAGFRLGSQNPQDNNTWGVSRAFLNAGDSIAPGQQKTFSWMVTAPAVPGAYNFQWRMLEEGVAWFGDLTTTVSVTVNGAGRNATFVTQNVPTTMTAGQSYQVSVTMQNSGGTTWTASDFYRLGSQNPQGNVTWGQARVSLNPGESILPGQQKVFSWTVTAPAVPGMYNFQWRMVQEGVAWFGDTTTNVVVTAAGPNAALITQSTPDTMTIGQTYLVSVTMQNTGSTTWTTANSYRLGSQNPQDNATWGMVRVNLDPGDNIAPGQHKTFTWTIRAPLVPGMYTFQWRMLEEGVTWFGPTSNDVVVKVMAPTDTGSIHFFGTGSGIDRVAIPLDAPAKPVDVGGDFTVEFWVKAGSGNASGTCTAGNNDNWRSGNVIIDRDESGGPSSTFTAYGIALFAGDGHIGFGVNRFGTGATICSGGATNVADGAWHHIAATRSTATGQLSIFVDGALSGSGTGPTGDVSYSNGRVGTSPADPFLVIGAEKYDTGASYHGWVDELRVSTVVRYTGAFTPPAAPFISDASTAALYHFDEDNGNRIFDGGLASGGPSNGTRQAGGTPAVPQWTTDVPFPGQAPAIVLHTLTTALNAPTSITNCGDTRLFITEQSGTIRIWDGTQILATPFLTVSPLSWGGERGLLSVAFHPQYAQNGFFYIYYTDPNGNVTIARYHVSANPDIADPTSGVILLSIPHPVANHNGGQLQFGSDGYLYAGVGDGGGSCDSTDGTCNAQRIDTMLGKQLRLDVNQNVTMPPYYGIPPTNPFVGPGDPKDEVWNTGLRNPFRFSFDRLTEALLIGDVGQNLREEVDYQLAESSGGENYGWNLMEGTLCGTCVPSGCPNPLPCTSPPLTLPILDYDHSVGCAIIGGYVYRGSQVPFLYGRYLFGDLCSGNLWWAAQNGTTWSQTLFGPLATNLYSFGQDVNGELYLVQGGGTLSKISGS